MSHIEILKEIKTALSINKSVKAKDTITIGDRVYYLKPIKQFINTLKNHISLENGYRLSEFIINWKG